MIEMTKRSISDVIDVPEFAAALQRGIDAFDRYRSMMPPTRNGYTRTLLEKHSHYELVGMLWAPGSKSPIHDHGPSRCWVVLMDGTLEVENYERDDDDDAIPHLKHVATELLGAGAIDYRLNRKELHRVRNRDDAAAYSLQLYAAPLSDYTIVDDLTGRARRMRAHYDAVVDL